MIIRKEQMKILQEAYGQEFRKQVMTHAKKKIVVDAVYPAQRLENAYESCAMILNPYVGVTYESYVRLTIVFLFLPLGNDEVSEYLRHPMVHPDSKSKCIYDLVRLYIKRKIIIY